MKLRSFKFVWILLIVVNNLFAQDTTVFTFDQFYKVIAINHPVAKQAALLPEMANSQVRMAKGNFDPVLQIDYDKKNTKGVNSYQYFEPEIKIPTRIGLDLKAGVDQSSGASVNPEIGKYDPVTGKTLDVNYSLVYAGFSLPVLRGLLTDQRRIELKQAQILIDLNKAEQLKILNKLFVSASKDYWKWQSAYQKYNYIKEGFLLAQNRLSFIKSRIKEGEEKPIDSVEAFIELKRREVLLAESNLELMNARILLSAYIWDEFNNPVLITPNTIPAAAGSQVVIINSDTLSRLISFAVQQHPELLKYTFKIGQLQFDKKLAIENLKPQFNLSYFPFQTYTNGSSDEVAGLFTKNYKLGFNFKSSLFLRKERGKLQLTSLKVKEAEFALQLGKRDLTNQVVVAYNELENIELMRNLQQDLVDNAALLRIAELQRFESGESSLFLVNQRERALLDAQSKLAEVIAKYAFAKSNLYFSAGLLTPVLNN